MRLTDTTDTCLTCYWSSLFVDLEVTCNNYHQSHPDADMTVCDLLEEAKAEHGSTYIGANCPGYRRHPLLLANKQGETP